jgi:Uma2 family endonuclease
MAVAEREPAQLHGPANDDRPPSYRWTSEKFYEMGEAGIFDGQPVMLVEGEILVMPPTSAPHQSVVSLVAEALRAVFGVGFFIREQAPFNVGSSTDLEPDVAAIRGGIRDFAVQHPSVSELVVEVSKTTLGYDRHENASLYAKAGVPEYWIVNLDRQPAQLEVHRAPRADAAEPYGFGYADVIAYLDGEIVQPLAASGPVAVSALLP